MQIVKTEILARETLDEKAFSDNAILRAIDVYNQERSASKKAQYFFEALTPLWKIYSKQSYVELFKSYIKMETGLESYSSDYSSHYSHVIHEFLFGYCIIMNSTAIKEEYKFKEGKNNPESEFGKLFFSWMAASLFHDVGYDIEKAPEEESFREFQNEFWDFMVPRAITNTPLQLKAGGEGRRLIENFILKNIRPYLSQNISYNDFEDLFITKIKRPGWVRYDHGIISAIKYLSELSKLEKQTGNNDYLSWTPNIHAALAMALHNFRFKNCDLKIPSSDSMTFISYLLIICDEIQAWERERKDVSEHDIQTINGKDSRKSVELLGLIFRQDYAFVSINHKLKLSTYRNKFEKYLDEKIANLKRDYPIQILIPSADFDRVWGYDEANDYDSGIKRLDKLKKIYWESKYGEYNYFTNINEIEAQKIDSELKLSKSRIKRLIKINAIKTEKPLLVPSEPAKYKIFVDHRVDGIPYLTIIFKI
jgi:hypothetical protein